MVKNTKKVGGVTKRTYDRKAKHFSLEIRQAWLALNKFVDSHSKGEKNREVMLDEVCAVVDRYSQITADMHEWCNKWGVNLDEFFCDTENKVDVTIEE